ncbi:MAG: hypothetical protein Q9167_000646 [Letrouitia subvulpina]
MAAEPIIGAGVLGSLHYDNRRQSWAIELGQWLGSFAIAFTRGRIGEQDVASLRRQIMASIERTLLRQSLHLNADQIWASCNKDAPKFAKELLDHVQSLKGSSVCALAIIGQCACGMRSAIPVSDQDTVEFLDHVARPSRCQQAATGRGTPRTRSSHSTNPFLRLLEASRHTELSSARDALDTYNPNILHFSGHGTRSGLCFEKDQGEVTVVEKTALVRPLSMQRELKLVVLNACYSRDQAQAIADAVGCVIGMEGSILDQDSIAFSREFYRALAYGRTFEEAFNRARSALGLTSTLVVHFLKK